MDELVGHGSAPSPEIEIDAVDAFRDRSEPFEKGRLAEIGEIVATACTGVIEAGEQPLSLPNFCPPEGGSPGYEQSTFLDPVLMNDDHRKFVVGHHVGTSMQ